MSEIDRNYDRRISRTFGAAIVSAAVMMLAGFVVWISDLTFVDLALASIFAIIVGLVSFFFIFVPGFLLAAVITERERRRMRDEKIYGE